MLELNEATVMRKKKLSLSRETLLNLSSASIGKMNVNGGSVEASCGGATDACCDGQWSFDAACTAWQTGMTCGFGPGPAGTRCLCGGGGSNGASICI